MPSKLQIETDLANSGTPVHSIQSKSYHTSLTTSQGRTLVIIQAYLHHLSRRKLNVAAGS